MDLLMLWQKQGYKFKNDFDKLDIKFQISSSDYSSKRPS